MSKLYQGEYKITSPFGPRTLPNGDKRLHKGIDTVGINNKNLIAVCDCTVVTSQIILDTSNPTWEWGNYIKLDDGHGYSLFYCHLSKRLVDKGMKVSKGQIIGIEGQTGYSFGSHCHFEVRNNQGKSIDPIGYFKILEEREAKELTVDEAKKIIMDKAGLDENTIKYLDFYKYNEALLLKLARAMK